MKEYGRRAILRALGAAPIAAPALAHSMTANATQRQFLGGALNAFQGEAANRPPSGAVSFTDFAKWLSEHGDVEIRRRSKDVICYDPDIVLMRLPLTTKHRMQQQRNYRRILEDQKSWFDRMLRVDGAVKVWT